jgi:hypothetical protein
VIPRRAGPCLDLGPHGRTIVSTQPLGQASMSPSQALRLAVAVVIAGIISILAASVDPWLLVMLAGLGVTAYGIYDRSGDGWVLSL